MPSGAGLRSLSFHHATSFAGSTRANLEFHCKSLGMRLVKRTVNFDEPFAHHLYYSSSKGEPGTILTSFPGYQHRPQARQNIVVSLTGSVPVEGSTLLDPDGQVLSLVPGDGPIRIYSATLKVADPSATREFFKLAMR